MCRTYIFNQQKQTDKWVSPRMLLTSLLQSASSMVQRGNSDALCINFLQIVLNCEHMAGFPPSLYDSINLYSFKNENSNIQLTVTFWMHLKVIILVSIQLGSPWTHKAKITVDGECLHWSLVLGDKTCIVTPSKKKKRVEVNTRIAKKKSMGKTLERIPR